MATASSFSYAQAAKGRGNSISGTPADAPAQDQSSTSAPPPSKPAPATEAPIETTDEARPANVEKQEVAKVSEQDVDAPSEPVPERRSEPKREEETERLNRPWRRNDKGTRSSSATTRSIDDHDSRKPRRGKKTKGSEKQAGEQTADQEQEQEPEPPKIELSEAPIPTVNPWHKRKEAQPVKAAAASSAPQQAAPKEEVENTKSATKPTEDGSDTAAAPGTVLPNGVKATRKTSDAPRPERNGSRGARGPEKDLKDGKSSMAPLAEDASLWPTPDTAITEEKKKPADKVERTETSSQDDNQGKPRQKKEWITYDYVPTANFETPLPNTRGSKPRGGARGPNGIRSGATNVASDKNTSAGSVKSNESRERARETSNGTGGAVQPPQQNKRAVADAPGTREPRKPADASAAGKTKESTQGQSSTETNHVPRERHEGRGERGRGGYRGRGGHHFANSHSQHQNMNGGNGFTQNGGSAPRAQGPYSPPNRQGGHGQMYMGSQRNGRGGRNGGSGNYHRMSMPNGGSRLPPVQTQYGAYDYSMGAMPPMPYQPAPVDPSLFALLKSQIEYYFSIENLCKDMFLRQRMDSQGFVPMHFVAAFKRMRELTLDHNLIRLVCENSPIVELVVGDDDGERLRRGSGWETFVLPMEERDELARNHGPAQFSHTPSRYSMGYGYPGMPMAYGMTSPSAMPVPTEFYPKYAEEQMGNHSANGMNGGAVNGHAAHSQLSADVPDFSPSGPMTNGHFDSQAVNGLPNGVHNESSKQEA